jgi:hypothetical protein
MAWMSALDAEELERLAQITARLRASAERG